MLSVTGNTLMTANWLLRSAGTVAFLAIFARTPIEEEKRVERLWNVYVQDMQRSGRCVPKCGRPDGLDLWLFLKRIHCRNFAVIAARWAA